MLNELFHLLLEQVGVDAMADTGMDVRRYLLLQHAKALGSCPSLWQLSALYAIDLLLKPESPSSSVAASDISLDSHAVASAAHARAWIRQLVMSQSTVHVLKLRKLVALCEQHQMQAEAEELVSYAMTCKRRRRRIREVPEPHHGDCSPEISSLECQELLETLACAALEEALCKLPGTAASGQAIVELRARLSNEGVGGARYYAGPPWLPPYVALLDAILDARGGGNDHLSSEFRIRDSILALVRARSNKLSSALPDSIMYQIMKLAYGPTGIWTGMGSDASAQPPAGNGINTLRPPQSKIDRVGASALPHGTLTAMDTYTLLGELEELKLLYLNPVPAHGVTCVPELSATDADDKLPHKLCTVLAESILGESAFAPPGSCWAA